MSTDNTSLQDYGVDDKDCRTEMTSSRRNDLPDSGGLKENATADISTNRRIPMLSYSIRLASRRREGLSEKCRVSRI